jgi:predicted transposase/invertase (TIGR01784 family)
MHEVALGAWINFFYYSHLISEDEMSTLLQGHPVVKQAHGKYQQFNRDERLRSLDEAHQRFLHDLATDVETAHEKGRVEGRVEEKVGIARNMKSEGFDIGIISRMTGLSSDEIGQLDG